jgi:hypothetical protein
MTAPSVTTPWVANCQNRRRQGPVKRARQLQNLRLWRVDRRRTPSNPLGMDFLGATRNDLGYRRDASAATVRTLRWLFQPSAESS